MTRGAFNMPNLPHEISIITITAGQECTGNYADRMCDYNLPRPENNILKTNNNNPRLGKSTTCKTYIFFSLFCFNHY